jgi:hypothetical protein
MRRQGGMLARREEGMQEGSWESAVLRWGVPGALLATGAGTMAFSLVYQAIVN